MSTTVTSTIPTTWARVVALRIARQHLLERAPRDRAVDVVREMVGLQAQVTSAADMQLAARVDSLRSDDIRDALANRSLVKTWAMRGTLHWFAADDLERFVAAYPTRDGTAKPAWVKAFGVAPEQLTTIVDEVGAVLKDVPITRAELADAVEHAAADPATAARLRSGWGELLKPAAGRGKLCFGPDRGRNVTFVSPDAWLGRPVAAARSTDPEQALVAFGALLGRWLRVFPGAGRDAAARWWGTARKPLAGEGARVAGLDLVDLDIEGTMGWVHRDDLAALEAAEPVSHVRLLPMFEPWVNELPRQVDQLLPVERHDAVHRTAGWVSAVVLIDGRVGGTWEIESCKGGAGTVAVEPFYHWRDGARRELGAEVERIAEFLDRPLSVRVGS
jgi:hypothetical protein